MSDPDDEMEEEYDFTHAERGKLYRPGARLHFPSYLEGDLASRVERYAEAEGKDWGEIVNKLLEQQLDLLEKKS